ncbi:Ankyrin repeat family protein [Hibiscus syriacus]|uniref:Ankyrin repeat family protein n=1 Tax=Hibiscus syriacus TaxID=106335 RepID=A0A6A2Z886_HIBSY|nr:Ankyrin repeat family protein [Hibiscus syriacus]
MSLVNQKNSNGDTPLHVVARTGSFETAEIFVNCAYSGEIEAGQRVVKMVNMVNDTALHDAARNGHFGLRILSLSSYMVKLLSPMTYLTNMSFKHSFMFFSFGPSAIIQAALQNNIYRDFAKLLLEKCPPALSEADEFGWTPLHYATHLGGFDIFRVFLNHADSSIAHKRDKQGMTIREDEAYILELLAYSFPEIWDVQDNKGQTAFHLTVERGKLASVKFILDSRVDKTVRNMEGLTVIDIILLEYGYYEKKVWSMQSTRTEEKQDRACQQQPQTGSDAAAVEAQFISNRKPEPAALRQPNLEQLQNIASINLVVTILIAIVSFAAGFTMPGGYKSDGPEEGMAILSRKLAFRVFVVANALDFCFSTTSMFLHYCKSFVENLDVHAFYTYLTTLLTSYGITAMVIGFVSGTYAALTDTPGFAKAVLSIGCSFFGLQLLVYLK